jgi:5-methylcytosine-specific restriction protein B
MDQHDAFETHLMEPFKRLFHDVADSLPSAVTQVLETEWRLFSRIPKNDFGRGGAWPWYWGAFYPRGSKRTDDVQLILSITDERLLYGFFIADHAAERREAFLQLCRDNYQGLKVLLQPVLLHEEFYLAAHEDITIRPGGTVESESDLTWQEWLKHPDKADFAISRVLPRDEVLACSEGELVDRIARTYQELFSLILLRTENDPLPAIANYLGGEVVPGPNPVYSIGDCADDTYFDEQTLSRWVRAIERKKQAILYGPPGTGKTYLAEHLAKHLIGGGDGFSEVVQFHPAYAYEDFIQGLRPDPTADGGLHFERTPGRFLDFCRKAGACDGRCVLIVDEINRANLSRVFGELMYLLEYRDREVPLAAGGEFRIPENVRIIGTMNTADRSIALVDHALRRRFAFLALYPAYDILRRYHAENDTGFDVEPLIEVLKRVNRQIDNRHYAVGITFFLLPELVKHVEDVWRMEIEPYLEEYFFDQPDKVEAFRWDEVREDILP